MTEFATVVLIHGGHAGGWVWESTQSLLSSPSIAVDLPGHGNRKEPLAGLTINLCVQAVVDVLPSKSAVVVVGHSLGASIALALTRAITNQIRHLVIVAGPVPEPGESTVSSFPLFMRLLSGIVLATRPESFSQPVSVAKSTLLNGLQESVAEAAAARFANESTSLVKDKVHWQRPLPCPATYVQCLRDRGPLSPAHQRRLAQRLCPTVSIRSLDACHYVMLERPHELAVIIDSVSDRPAIAQESDSR